MKIFPGKHRNDQGIIPIVVLLWLAAIGLFSTGVLGGLLLSKASSTADSVGSGFLLLVAVGGLFLVWRAKNRAGKNL